MHRAFILCAVALIVVGSTAAALAASFGQPVVVAAGMQPFFAGSWRCSSGNLNVSQQFGPWFSWRSQSGNSISQSSVYNDSTGRGWVFVGVDSSGGYWTQTSNGWQGNTMTFNGTYTNQSRAQSQRQVFTRTAANRFNAATYRNGALVGQNSCTRG